MLLEKVIEQGRIHGNQIAIVDDRRSITFRQLRHGSNIMAGHVDHAAGNQDRVGLLIPQSSAFAVAFMGSRWTGRIVVPLNYLLRPPELVEICRDAGLKTVFTIRFFKDHAAAMIAAGIKVIFLEELSFKKIPWPRRLPPRRPYDTAVIIYTSGTSAASKGVMLTNDNLNSDVEDSIVQARFNSQMTFLGILPMFHALGLMAGCMAPL